MSEGESKIRRNKREKIKRLEKDKESLEAKIRYYENLDESEEGMDLTSTKERLTEIEEELTSLKAGIVERGFTEEQSRQKKEGDESSSEAETTAESVQPEKAEIEPEQPEQEEKKSFKKYIDAITDSFGNSLEEVRSMVDTEKIKTWTKEAKKAVRDWFGKSARGVKGLASMDKKELLTQVATPAAAAIAMRALLRSQTSLIPEAIGALVGGGFGGYREFKKEKRAKEERRQRFEQIYRDVREKASFQNLWTVATEKSVVEALNTLLAVESEIEKESRGFKDMKDGGEIGNINDLLSFIQREKQVLTQQEELLQEKGADRLLKFIESSDEYYKNHTDLSLERREELDEILNKYEKKIDKDKEIAAGMRMDRKKIVRGVAKGVARGFVVASIADFVAERLFGLSEGAQTSAEQTDRIDVEEAAPETTAEVGDSVTPPSDTVNTGATPDSILGRLSEAETEPDSSLTQGPKAEPHTDSVSTAQRTEGADSVDESESGEQPGEDVNKPEAEKVKITPIGFEIEGEQININSELQEVTTEAGKNGVSYLVEDQLQSIVEQLQGNQQVLEEVFGSSDIDALTLKEKLMEMLKEPADVNGKELSIIDENGQEVRLGNAELNRVWIEWVGQDETNPSGFKIHVEGPTYPEIPDYAVSSSSEVEKQINTEPKIEMASDQEIYNTKDAIDTAYIDSDQLTEQSALNQELARENPDNPGASSERSTDNGTEDGFEESAEVAEARQNLSTLKKEIQFEKNANFMNRTLSEQRNLISGWSDTYNETITTAENFDEVHQTNEILGEGETVNKMIDSMNTTYRSYTDKLRNVVLKEYAGLEPNEYYEVADTRIKKLLNSSQNSEQLSSFIERLSPKEGDMQMSLGEFLRSKLTASDIDRLVMETNK